MQLLRAVKVISRRYKLNLDWTSGLIVLEAATPSEKEWTNVCTVMLIMIAKQLAG